MSHEETVELIIKNIEDAKGIKRKSVRTIQDALEVIAEGLIHIERFFKDFAKAGSEKQEVLASVVNHFVDIPYIPEAVEQIIFEKIIRYGVPLAIKVANRLAAMMKLGDNWKEFFRIENQ